MLEDFRRLRARMKREGLFHSSIAFYVWKTVTLAGMYSTVAMILTHAQDTWLECLAAAFMLALCWQQTGWLSHDFLHHQVFQNRTLNTAVGYFNGNLLQGFSVDWWKNKHNKHHAVPNECDEHAHAVDPGAHLQSLLVVGHVTFCEVTINNGVVRRARGRSCACTWLQHHHSAHLQRWPGQPIECNV